MASSSAQTPKAVERCAEPTRECGFEEGEWIEFDLDRLSVGQPDARGRVSVSGFAERNSLVTVTNRGLSGVGRPQQQPFQRTLSSDVGEFRFATFKAHGDDELVLQVQDLNGFRSPAVSVLVPDAALEGVDVTGVFPWRPLRDGKCRHGGGPSRSVRNRSVRYLPRPW